MVIDLNSLVPVKEVNGVERLAHPIDFNSLQPITAIEESFFGIADSDNVFMEQAKNLFRGIERMPAGLAKGISFVGRDIIAESESPTTPWHPMIRQWRRPKEQNAVTEKIDDFFIKFGTQIAEIGDTASEFYEKAASTGAEAPNPAVMMGWEHPFRKTVGLAVENTPMLLMAAGVSVATGSPIAGGLTFAPTIAGDMYEEAIKHGVDPHVAADMAIADAGVQAWLEGWVLTNWMKGGSYFKRVTRTMVQEGLVEEGLQQEFENGLKVIGWDDGRPVWDRMMDGLAESIAAGSLMGFTLGHFHAPSIMDVKHDVAKKITNIGMKQGKSDEQISEAINKANATIDKVVSGEIKPGDARLVTDMDGKPIMIGEELITPEFLKEEMRKAKTPEEQEAVVEKTQEYFRRLNEALDAEEEITIEAKEVLPDITPETFESEEDKNIFQLEDLIIMAKKGFKGTEKQWKAIMSAFLDDENKMQMAFQNKVFQGELSLYLDNLLIKGGEDLESLVQFYADMDNISKEEARKVVEGLPNFILEGSDETMGVFDALVDSVPGFEEAFKESILRASKSEQPGKQQAAATQVMNNAEKITESFLAQPGINFGEAIDKRIVNIEKAINQNVNSGGFYTSTKDGNRLTNEELDLFLKQLDESESALKQKGQWSDSHGIMYEHDRLVVSQLKRGGHLGPAYELEEGQPAPEESGKTTDKSTKKIPPGTQEGFSWEKTKAWSVNLGRDIAGVFEREVGPHLEISKRFRRFAGAYYSWLGKNGLIRLKHFSPDNMKTLYHEVGHFLDDYMSGLKGWKIGENKVFRPELLAVTKYLNPFTERYVTTKSGKKRFDKYTTYRRSNVELFAQFVALYGMDKEMARKLAPGYTELVEQEIAKDKEFAYIIDKMTEFEEIMKPMKDFIAGLRKIPELNRDMTKWSEKSNFFNKLWQDVIGDKVWDAYMKAMEKARKQKVLKSFFTKKDINAAVFDILRQRHKLVHGQQQRVLEELIKDLSQLSKEDQQAIAEALQRFDAKLEDPHLNKLTEEARRELAVWGNEARKMGLLSDLVFWNNVGQYFPFFYSKKEFDANDRKLSLYNSKKLRAKFSAFKHKMTDEEFGHEVLIARFGKWPSSMRKVNSFSKEQKAAIGRQAREDLGLIKTAAFPLQKRLLELIESVYTVKAFNQIAFIPGIIGVKGTPGFSQMPTGKKYGAMSGEYAPNSLVKEANRWNELIGELKSVLLTANGIWKMFKVPYDTNAIVRNMVTNTILAWMGDVPVYNSTVVFSGIKAFTDKGEIYKSLRDNGLYRNTYSSEEMQALADFVNENPEKPSSGIMKWAKWIVTQGRRPANFYGSVEDASKTVIAKYVLDNGGTMKQAIDFADKLLFDYSEISEFVGMAKMSFLPFFTWSAKVLPLLVETAIRKPGKFIILGGLITVFNGMSRAMLGINPEEEEELKPDYIRGKSTFLLPWEDLNGDLNWIDLTYFLPWGNWLPVEKGRLGVPDAFTIGNPLIAASNAFVTNYDPFVGEIAPSYLTKADQEKARWGYLGKSLLPRQLAQTPFRIVRAKYPDKYKRKDSLGKIAFGEFLALRAISDTSAYRGKIQKRFLFDFARGKKYYQDMVRTGAMSPAQAKQKIKELRKEIRKKQKTH